MTSAAREEAETVTRQIQFPPPLALPHN